MAKTVVNPTAELPPRPGDVLLSLEQLAVLSVFASAKKMSPQVRAEVNRLIAGRKESDQRIAAASIHSVSRSSRAEELGILQGQKLMLIDLDRCTCCGDCVEACISTHNDGHSRLFLDGPRLALVRLAVGSAASGMRLHRVLCGRGRFALPRSRAMPGRRDMGLGLSRQVVCSSRATGLVLQTASARG